MIERQKNIESIYPLSPMQQGMLFHTLLSPKSGVYFNQVLYTLTGRLHEEALQHAWQQAVDRHPSLRTLFLCEGRVKPLQVVRQRVSLPWEQLDWRVLSAEEQNSKLTAFLRADRERGFDLAQAPLMRLTLVRLEEDHWELIWSHHHVLLDGWSSFLVLKDVTAIYQALSEGRDCQLRSVCPYQDYISWLQKQDLLKAEEFWREALKGFAAPTPLLGSSLHRKHEDHDYEASDLHARWPPSLMAELRAFASQHGLTLNTIVQGAWAILLSRYSGDEDVVFGSTVSGRPADLAGVESMVGLLINTLPVRAQFSSQDVTLSWLKLFQNQLVELRQYEYAPLVDVQSWSDVRRDRPLFESLIAFENYPVDASAWGKSGTLKVLNMRVVAPVNFALSLVVVPKEELCLRVNYDSRRFEVDTVRRMLRHYQALLEAIAANPEGRLSELPLLTELEQKQLQEDWNQTAVSYPLDRCVHELFEEQVERTPDAIAVVFEGENVTYRELDRRAGRLACQLRTLGVGTGILVALFLERSVDMVVGALGVLKAGGAYVPLDPAHPLRRVSAILADAQPAVLLTQSALQAKLPASASHVLAIDAEQTSPTTDIPASRPSPSDLAYVIYTSGSTGAPKGVEIEHRSVVNMLQSMQRLPGLAADDTLLALTTLAFDISVLEIFLPLTCGARVVVAPGETASDAQALAGLIVRCGATVIQATPSTLRMLLDAGWHAGPRLKILCGGEAWTSELARQLLPTCGSLWNMYGPTETTVWSAVAKVESDRPIAIGRAISSTKLYVLDNARQLVPLGVPGELYISGAGLARGYLKRPELTRERFMIDPFSSTAGARMYRTGDLVRRMVDGSMEFLGRQDNQVKIRGNRVELGEIESALLRYTGIGQAIAVGDDEEMGQKRLVAYLVPKSETLADEDESREQIDRVGEWRAIWDATYSLPGKPSFVGWKSSYTNNPISQVEMQEWLERTIERIAALNPTRVLEIGCGNGLILKRIAPLCKTYLGTDISASAINELQGWVGAQGGLDHVVLEQREAINFDALKQGWFDTVIINSIVQYFPSADYFFQVLKSVVTLVSPKGRVFIGDLRHFGLLRAFHTSVQLARSNPNSRIDQLNLSVELACENEGELTVDPDLFPLLQQHLPEIGAVEILIKRGQFENELTCYRYDVVLCVGEAPTRGPSETVEWDRERRGFLEEIELRLKEGRVPLRILNVPNRRVSRDITAVRTLQAPQSLYTVGDLRDRIDASEISGEDPEQFWAVGERAGLQTRLSWASQSSDGCFDALYFNSSSGLADTVTPLPSYASEPAKLPPIEWRACFSDPMKTKRQGGLSNRLDVHDLRRFLGGALPEYMIPSAFVVLERFPLTPNGKVDRKALPRPDMEASDAAEFAPPKTETQKALADIWSGVFKMPRIGLHDNFFDLGGHSLLAARVASRVSATFGVRLPLRLLFEYPTLAGLAAQVDSLQRIGRHPRKAPPGALGPIEEGTL